MGLTFESTKNSSLTDIFKIEKKDSQYIIALAGNPNTGKSTVFNSLTGLHQHTGNWPGKTVVNARGEFTHNSKENILVDLPGTYSLFASSVEEEVARDFICFGNSDAVIVVTDATCLERNLNLVFQAMELRQNVILCINLIDEAKKKNIKIDAKGIEQELGIPVVLCAAKSGQGIKELKESVYKVTTGQIKPNPKVLMYDNYIEEKIKAIQPIIEKNIQNINSRWLALRIIDGDKKLIASISSNIDSNSLEEIMNIVKEFNLHDENRNIRDDISKEIYIKAEEVRDKYVKEDKSKMNRDRVIDNYITSKIFGIPLMLLVLAMVFWITITGANIPSEMIANVLFALEDKLTLCFTNMNAPSWLHGILILGLYRTLAWVISVMLPPMAIFFPIFTLLEDLGYLPRVAFNLDHLFKKACAHGKQCLTMCMGFGCNAAGIISCRIIESPRERLIAILTNNFVPCNGRFPTLIAIATVFLVSKGGSEFSFLPALSVTALVIIGISVTLLVSYGLSKTILKGVPSTFTLELPPYRVPKIGRVLYTSIIDRTIFVLWRAAVIAAPAGAITWILANIYIGDLSIIGHFAAFLDPFAQIIGIDGYILMAFILGLPANEIVLPILMMCYLSTGSMIEFNSIDSLREILLNNGWTYLTALNTMLFSLLHWPCATTLLTIKKETGSLKWTAIAALLPTCIAISVCFMTSIIFRLLGLA
ncbi:ferrous iron transport protein B [Clostridium chromiireducens]|uniref:Ferrous iron transport protein B n=1 Tax=Clostridium chromiireducens TaxID=225345 RepID=A0A964RSX4_9CLOT|nr:ferrous iron transport protein B [Clostridium chromiireducens]MVX67202.1 ferrous iron transport protein B [Clostridium chromiireducens]